MTARPLLPKQWPTNNPHHGVSSSKYQDFAAPGNVPISFSHCTIFGLCAFVPTISFKPRCFFASLIHSNSCIFYFSIKKGRLISDDLSLLFTIDKFVSRFLRPLLHHSRGKGFDGIHRVTCQNADKRTGNSASPNLIYHQKPFHYRCRCHCRYNRLENTRNNLVVVFNARPRTTDNAAPYGKQVAKLEKIHYSPFRPSFSFLPENKNLSELLPAKRHKNDRIGGITMPV
nr:MAG TPA: hypothetical protein [Caudoviricetes sp.]